jgi:hypothetical protein
MPDVNTQVARRKKEPGDALGEYEWWLFSVILGRIVSS